MPIPLPLYLCRAALLCIALAWHPAIAMAASGELRIGISGEVTSLDPHYLAAQPNLTVGRHVFESLTDVDPQTKLIPGLAISWRALDATSWEFNLRSTLIFRQSRENSSMILRVRNFLPSVVLSSMKS